MKTEKTLELMLHFKTKGVNQVKDLQNICDYQDCIMQSNEKELFEFYESLGQDERETFHWINFNILGMDSALNILKQTAGKTLQKKYMDQAHKHIESEYNESTALWSRYQECKRSIWRKLRKIKNLATFYEDKMNYWKNRALVAESERLEAGRQLHTYRDSAERYHRIKELLEI